MDKFVQEKAPRTAAVIHNNGSFSLIQVSCLWYSMWSVYDNIRGTAF